MRTFWSFHASAGDAADAPALPDELRIDGEIADDDDAWWYEDGKVTCPDAFRAALEAVDGDLTVAINSPGGDVIAASCIYAMLREFAGREGPGRGASGVHQNFSQPHAGNYGPTQALGSAF